MSTRLPATDVAAVRAEALLEAADEADRAAAIYDRRGDAARAGALAAFAGRLRRLAEGGRS